MRILIAPDSFKGTFTSKEVIEHLCKGLKHHIEEVSFVKVPIADGGEGTVDAILEATHGEKIYKTVKDPLLRDVKTYYGIIGDTAVIEMASASGITLVTEEEKNPLKTSTYGTGELIKDALDRGVSKILVGIGGSATNDGGMGMAKALGAKFYNESQEEIGDGGMDLRSVHSIDITNLDPRLKTTDIEVICDVTNPLTGPEGATFTYGPQKGATEAMIEILENGMVNYHHVIEETFNITLNDIPGTGAAGGLGGGLVTFCQGILMPGIDTVLDTVKFDELLEGVDLVITGEGKLDSQSVYGKVPVGVAARCKNPKIPVIAFCGALGDGAEAVFEYNIDALFSTVSDVISFEEIVANKEQIMNDSVDRLARLLKVGMILK